MGPPSPLKEEFITTRTQSHVTSWEALANKRRHRSKIEMIELQGACPPHQALHKNQTLDITLVEVISRPLAQVGQKLFKMLLQFMDIPFCSV